MLIHSKDPETSDLNHLFLFSFNSTAWILIFYSVFHFWLGCNLGSLQYHTGSQSDAILIITYKDVSCSCSCQHSPCWCLHCILWCNLYQSKSCLLSIYTMSLGMCSWVLPWSDHQNARDPACQSLSLASLPVFAHQFWPKVLQIVCKITAWRQEGRLFMLMFKIGL